MELKNKTMLNADFKAAKKEFDKLVIDIFNGERAISYSALKPFITDGPRGFFKSRMFREQTVAMTDGVAFHMCCLEPEKYDKTYEVFDDSGVVEALTSGFMYDCEVCKNTYNKVMKTYKSGRSCAEYKQWKADYMQAKQGVEFIDADKDRLFRSMKDYLRQNQQTAPYMNALFEKEVTKSFDLDGFSVITKIDGIGKDERGEFTLDLKKCADASINKVRWAVRDMLYDIQGAMYSLANGTRRHVIIFIDASHKVFTVELSAEMLEDKCDELSGWIGKFQQCIEEDAWNESVNYLNNNNILIL